MQVCRRMFGRWKPVQSIKGGYIRIVQWQRTLVTPSNVQGLLYRLARDPKGLCRAGTGIGTPAPKRARVELQLASTHAVQLDLLATLET